MAKEIPVWTQAGLPGRPVTATPSGAFEDVMPGRIIRNNTGKVIYFTNDQDARYVQELSSDYLEKDIYRVFFKRRNGEFQKQHALAGPKNASLNKCEVAAIEALAWACAKDIEKVKKKIIRLAVAR